MSWYKKKGNPKSKADATAWGWFSKYIRIRDSDGRGYGACFTCQKINPIKDMDAGHFVSRDHKSVKFDEKNVHLQCRSCNRFGGGMGGMYAINLDKVYGVGTAEALIEKGEERGKLPEYKLREISDEYREKFNQQKESKLWEAQ